MAFNKWTKQMADKQRTSDPEESLSSMRVSLRERRDDPSRTQRSDFLAIQDKINKALQDIDDIYDKTTSDDPLINDIQSELDGMENGQFKLKLTSLIQKYNDQNAKVESMDNDRVQILSDLSDWFSMDHMDDGEPKGRNHEEVAEAKFEFAKFKEMNEQLKNMKQDEAGFTDMEKERNMLQGKVTNAFKSLKENAQRQEVVRDVAQPTEQDSGWKHAAGEIVDLLGKVRQEGKDYITELEQKVKQILKDMDDLGRKLKRCENSLAEKREMEKKWKEESTRQTKEKAMMQSKLKKMKQELVKTRQLLGRHEVVAPVSGLGGSSVEIDSGSGHHDKEAEIHNLQSQLDTMQKENTAAQERIKNLESSLEKKDEELSTLEHDKLELLYQMKQAAVRPDVRYLSNQSMNSAASLSLTVTSTTSVVIESKVTVKEQQKSPTEDRKGEVSKARSSEICSKCKGDLEAKQSETTKKPQQKVTVAQTQKEEEKSSGKQSEAELDLIQKLEGAQKQVVQLEEQLVKAHQELLQAKSKPPSQAPCSTPVPNDSRPNTVGIKSPGKREDTPQQVTPGKTKRSMEYEWGIIKDSVGRQQEVWIKNKADDGTQVTLRDQCIQTDPHLDPLTDWSKPHEHERGWRPPVPPNNWVQFDPTMPMGSQAHRRSIDHSMLTGAEPSEVKQQTDSTVIYIANQLSRMIEGITGFKEYIDIIVDRETTDMTRANNKLKSLMSPNELQVLDEETSQTQGSATKDYMELSSTLSVELEELTEMGKTEMASDQVKKSMGIIVSKTIMMLAHTVERLREQIQEQYRQYECIYSALQKRPSGFQLAMDELLEDDEHTAPKLQRSRSLCALDELAREHGMEEDQLEHGLVGRYLNVQTEPNAQRSHSDIIIKENIMTGQTEDRTAASRKLMNVSQAIVPKKDMEAQRRKTKPAPQSHNKLKKRQIDLMNKNKGKVLTPTKRMARVSTELPPDYYDGYTIGDLEQRVEEYGETLANTEHMKVVEATADLRTDTDRRDVMGETLPQLQRTETLPPIRHPRTAKDTMRFPPIKQ